MTKPKLLQRWFFGPPGWSLVAIRSAAPPEATEAISYRIPTFKYKGPLLGFAAFPNPDENALSGN